MATMTKSERQDLVQLVRKREKVMKAQAAERSAQLLADFEASSAKIYHYDEDPIWQDLYEEAQKAVEAAQEKIAERCREKGIPAEFAPGIQLGWFGRGHNGVAERRTELRRAAKKRIEAIEASALAQIEKHSLEAQTQIIANGLESEAAKTFLNTMPKLEELMPPVQVLEMQKLLDQEQVERKRLGYLN